MQHATEFGRLPVILGRSDDGHCVTFESFAMQKLGYQPLRELGPGEIVRITADEVEVLAAPGPKRKYVPFCGLIMATQTQCMKGVNVEVMRMKNGEILAQTDRATGIAQDIDYVCGVPDSGVPHAIGYANASHVPYARPFIKYTPDLAAQLYADTPGNPKSGRKNETNSRSCID